MSTAQMCPQVDRHGEQCTNGRGHTGKCGHINGFWWPGLEPKPPRVPAPRDGDPRTFPAG